MLQLCYDVLSGIDSVTRLWYNFFMTTTNTTHKFHTNKLGYLVIPVEIRYVDGRIERQSYCVTSARQANRYAREIIGNGGVLAIDTDGCSSFTIAR
jgi:hypothetical protein